jgi:hypothetical protein
MTVEVFKTNVDKRKNADILLQHIHRNFVGYIANFDLDDCDKILRVQCNGRTIKAKALILFLKDFGFHAEVLTD